MRKDLFPEIDRDTLIKTLVEDFFDEVLLINTRTEETVDVMVSVFDCHRPYREYGTHDYHERIIRALRDVMSDEDRDRIEDEIRLEKVRAELEKKGHYTVTFTLNSVLKKRTICKEITYRYLKGGRDFIVMQCRDATNVLFNDLDAESKELLHEYGDALREGQFEVWFQPQFDFKNRKVIGAEALVRWKHPEKGMISPAKFIPLLESNGCIGALDKYVFEHVCNYVAKWREEGLGDPIPVSVNLSRTDLLYKRFCDDLIRIAAQKQLPNAAVNLEITESAYLQNSEQLTTVVRLLRENGFKIEMDDFGSGYSSLNSLKDIDIDRLKLDMKFLSDTKNNEKSQIILSSMITMAKDLRIPVIAEGVETIEQAEMLHQFGCEQMQGYYFSKPMPAIEFEGFLRKCGA